MAITPQVNSVHQEGTWIFSLKNNKFYMAYIFSAFSGVSISSKTRNTLLKSSELSHAIKETPSNSQTRKPNIKVRTVRNVTNTYCVIPLIPREGYF